MPPVSSDLGQGAVGLAPVRIHSTASTASVKRYRGPSSATPSHRLGSGHLERPSTVGSAVGRPSVRTYDRPTVAGGPEQRGFLPRSLPAPGHWGMHASTLTCPFRGACSRAIGAWWNAGLCSLERCWDLDRAGCLRRRNRRMSPRDRFPTPLGAGGLEVVLRCGPVGRMLDRSSLANT